MAGDRYFYLNISIFTLFSSTYSVIDVDMLNRSNVKNFVLLILIMVFILLNCYIFLNCRTRIGFKRMLHLPGGATMKGERYFQHKIVLFQISKTRISIKIFMDLVK